MTPCLRATSNDVARVSGAEADVDRLSHQLDKREREQHTSKKNDEDSDNDEWDEFDEDEEYDEDVEIFNFETGWNLVGMDDEWDEEDELDVGERQERFLAGVQIPQKLQKQLLREVCFICKSAKLCPHLRNVYFSIDFFMVVHFVMFALLCIGLACN